MVTLAIWQKQHLLSKNALKEQMPSTIRIRPDPRTNEKVFDESGLNDSEAIYELMEGDPWLGSDGNLVREFQAPCQVSRRSVPYVEGGPAPADDYNDIWDVVIPGGVDDTVRVSQVAIILRRTSPVPDALTPDPLNLRPVYTITAIGQDRLKYIARITMVAYGLRS